ncbi:flagellar biosynthesis protein FlgF [Colwellia sp. MT41]|uniref:Flagellar basal-body rod protein FlgF n=1 Tax=Colwellia marinimaniae TaxID=1513592 RepID=A0ABQ0MV82_9GAMM|nr:MULTISPECIES: flagellar basal-body rod protein FlgF [Colwellia]ALO34261.1 flagellar biosynthesis protein FlgF [Colwellia sp. MT41]GAW96274.1 flagellar basal-body rod protein FlgF [Colwellia marinimaniae]
MDKLLYIAMSGAKQNMQALSINAHNLANANTTGFKADLAQARSMQVYGEGMASRVFSMTERASQNFDSGAILHTGRSLDVAIAGDGFFAVQAEDGQEAYTRGGHFRLTETGALETNDGELVIGEDGPIIIPLPVNNIQISRDGTIMVQPAGAPSSVQEEVARIKLVNPDTRLIEKGNDGLFRAKNGEQLIADINVNVLGGSLESSNVNPIHEMTAMISLQRQFEMQLKMMKTAEEIDASAASLLRAF